MFFKKTGQKIRYLLRRHSFFYKVRYLLIVRFTKRELLDAEYSNKYVQESQIPAEFLAIIARLDLSKERTFESAKSIAFDLSHGHARGAGLSCDSLTVLRSIYSGQAGVCSDYSQVYLGLCIAAGIIVREWGVIEDYPVRPNVLGHAFNEIYSTEMNKWVFIDSFRSIIAYDNRAGLPLSVAEMIDLATSGRADQIEFHYIDLNQKGQESCPHAALYLNPGNIFFLISNNQVFKQDKFLRLPHLLPLPVLHILMWGSGIYQNYLIYTNRHNSALMQRKYSSLMSSLGLAPFVKRLSPKRFTSA